MSPVLSVEIDGKNVPLSECDWVEWGPCGCPFGVHMAAFGPEAVATNEAAWNAFYPLKRERERARRAGYRVELMTHTRYTAEVADRMCVPCPHEGVSR